MTSTTASNCPSHNFITIDLPPSPWTLDLPSTQMICTNCDARS